MQLEIHKDLFEKCDLFKNEDHPASFFAWIGSNIRHESVSSDSLIYSEFDAIHEIFILQKGLAGYFLPKYRSFFAVVEPGDIFGNIDYRMAKKKNHIEEEEEDSSSSESSDNKMFNDSFDEENDGPKHRGKQRRRNSKSQKKLSNPKWCRMFTMRTIKNCELVTLSSANLMNM